MNKLLPLLHSRKIHFIVLGVLFVVLNILVFQKFGIKVVSDSYRYLEWSENPFSELSPTNWKFYSVSYVGFLALIRSLGLGLEGVVFVQMLISGIACFYLYQLTFRVSQSSLAAFLASFLYLSFGEIVQWNTYILTESLFTSGIIFLMFGLHNAQKTKQWLILLPLGIMVCLVRPMGITVFLSAMVFLFFRFQIYQRLSWFWKFTGAVLLISIGCVMFYFLLEGNPSVNFYYSRGQIVWGTDSPELRNNPWLILGNENVVYPSRDLPAYQMFLTFVKDNFTFFSELFLKKAALFIAHVKPYYSTWHNVYIVLFLGLTYFAGFKGLFMLKRTHPIAWFALSLFILNTLMVGLSVEAWEGRFLIPVLSPIFVFSATVCGRAKFLN